MAAREVAGGGLSRRWMILAATVWIQAFTGTNFDFPAYSSALKAAMGISQVQLNYLATASDLGKALGWSSGLALIYLPLPVVLVMAAAIGFAAYAAQWLLITGNISLSYFPVFVLCLLAGCSICWFNTVCFVLCIRSFPLDRSLALALTISFNGVSAALYTLAADAVDGSSATYLLLNAILPCLASAAALVPILRQPPAHFLPLRATTHSRDSHTFLVLHVLAFLTGLYLLFFNSISSIAVAACLLLVGAIFFFLLPICVPGAVYSRAWASRNMLSSNMFELSTNANDLTGDLQERLITGKSIDSGAGDGAISIEHCWEGPQQSWPPQWSCWCDEMMGKDRLTTVGEEHSAKRLVRRIDFWLYYVAYFCGATIGLVYSNNIGQIAQSLGRASETTMLVNVYSSCSFFGRLLSSAPDFLRGKVYFARTGWMVVAMLPMPLAFLLLAEAHDGHALLGGTALIGLSSGFIFATAVSVTSELFGFNSMGVNHNLLITNIPLGSLLYGLLAALIYDSNGKSAVATGTNDEMVVCMGAKCYAKTFLCWGCISFVGFASVVVLYLRTRLVYMEAERRQPIIVTESFGSQEEFR